jgi:acetolactate synthase-1/2/3 large subunit
MNGGERVAEVLKAHGVPYLFTLCGGHISPILVESKKRGIRIVDVRDEVNAVFAADSVARLTGRPGVAAVTAGPGVTNAITAIKNAQMAQSPLIVLGGATATALRGRGSLQDIDQMALVKPHVKWAARPNRLREVIPAMEKAFKVANEGVPGPVFVELAIDLLYDEELVRDWTLGKLPGKDLASKAIGLYLRGHLKWVYGQAADTTIAKPSIRDLMPAEDSEVLAAADLLADSERPVMVVGSQVTLDPKRCAAVADAIGRLGVPVFLSGMARGLLGPKHELQMNHKRRNALKEADLVILAGVPCDFRLDYGNHITRKANYISINRSKKDLRKNRRPTLGVLCDPQTFLIQVADRMGTNAARRGDWIARLRDRNDARNIEIATMSEEVIEPLNPLDVCRKLDKHLDDKSILVGDGGDWVATAAYTLKPRGPLTWLDPGVFGTLGVGAGFAIGAKLVKPDHDVWLIYGDGAAGFSISELDTMVRHNLPIIAVVGNDAGWTQIARDQEVILNDNVGCVLTRNDYHKVATAWGAKGLLLDDPAKIDKVFKEALKFSRKGQPVLINVLIGRSDFRKGSISM